MVKLELIEILQQKILLICAAICGVTCALDVYWGLDIPNALVSGLFAFVPLALMHGIIIPLSGSNLKKSFDILAGWIASILGILIYISHFIGSILNPGPRDMLLFPIVMPLFHFFLVLKLLLFSLLIEWAYLIFNKFFRS